MTNKNIQMKKREGNDWDNLFPISLTENIYTNDGANLDDEIGRLEQKDEDLTAQLTQTEQEFSSQLSQTDTQLNHTNDRITKLSTRNLQNIPFNFKDSGGILFTPNASTLGQASFSSVIRMDDKIENPIDNFYMYWAGHDGGGIRLSTAPNPLGPWTHYPNASSPLINDKYFNADVGHISSPEIVYDDVNKKFVLFYHHYLDGLQPTLRVESTDGINFSNPIEILLCPNNGSWDGIERSYLRVIIVNGVWHGVYQGRNGALDPHVHTGYITSKDGYTWTRLSHPLWYDNQFTNYADGFNLQGGIGGSPSLLYYQNQLWNFYANGQNVREIYVAPINDLHEREVKPIKVMNNPSWASAGGLESPNFLEHDGILYMYYNDYQSDGKRRIGVATMEVGV